MNRILILGGSGFIGNALYKELCAYYDTYGTYFTNPTFRNNKHFYYFNFLEDDIYEILAEVKPNYIISCIRGDFAHQVDLHFQLTDYVAPRRCKLIFISSANVFDAFSNYPSYEYDKTLSMSVYGKLKIKIENMCMRLPDRKYAIARVPMVFGKQSPRIKQLKKYIELHEAYEVFPDLVMNVTSDNRLTQQIHYIINRKRSGIFHLGSSDLIHHDEFIKDIIEKLEFKKPLIKNVYTSNFDRFLAVLPKNNKLPEHLQFSYNQVLEDLMPV
ncbi:sugar nucleotide-binding protein [Zhouia sp. PK063]|uniref:sugar nucleotide-binding protein n=1 Tax=Zhouia sp. PK063 TaxID=3373602 RepID=UPI0037BD0D31